MKMRVLLLVVGFLGVRAAPVFAAGCSDCAQVVGGFVSLESANQLVSASTVTAAVSSVFGILSAAGAAGSLGYAIKGERPGRLWAHLAFAIGIAAASAGLLNIGLGVLAMVQPEASTYVTSGAVSVAPIMLLDRQNNAAPGMGAVFVIP